eukprot:505048_1
MAERILRPNFRTIHGRTYSFNMSNHIDGNLPVCLNRIYRNINVDFDLHARDGGDVVISIGPQHELINLLDEYDQANGGNFLIFRISNNDQRVNVTHFGPFSVDQKRITLGKIWQDA